MSRTRRPSPQALRLLGALAETPGGWRHGYELSQTTGLKTGTLYPLLIRLHEAGLLESEWRAPHAPGRPARHAYRLTAAGARVLAAETRRAPFALSTPSGAFG
jgi:DNA-binding PadR family transcriptional regulator